MNLVDNPNHNHNLNPVIAIWLLAWMQILHICPMLPCNNKLLLTLTHFQIQTLPLQLLVNHNHNNLRVMPMLILLCSNNNHNNNHPLNLSKASLLNKSPLHKHLHNKFLLNKLQLNKSHPHWLLLNNLELLRVLLLVQEIIIKLLSLLNNNNNHHKVEANNLKSPNKECLQEILLLHLDLVNNNNNNNNHKHKANLKAIAQLMRCSLWKMKILWINNNEQCDYKYTNLRFLKNSQSTHSHFSIELKFCRFWSSWSLPY